MIFDATTPAVKAFVSAVRASVRRNLLVSPTEKQVNITIILMILCLTSSLLCWAGQKRDLIVIPAGR